MLPKKINKKISYDETPILNHDKYMEYGYERIKQLLHQTDTNTIHLPRTIDFFDLDLAVRNLFRDNDLKLVVDGKDVPVIYLENDRWGEFAKTWVLMDGDRNVPTPYITIRRVGKLPGTRIGAKYNVPQNKRFIYKQIPIMDDGELVYLLYKMPQPTNVDLTYEVSLFTKLRIHLNEMDKLLFTSYSSRQLYVDVNGLKFPTTLEDTNEVSTMQNIEDDKLIIGEYTIKLLGSIQYEDTFEIVKASRKPIFTPNIY